MSRVSVVMSTYNGEKFVGEQITSILASTYQDIDLYIHDDCSSDTTMDILNQYAAEFPDQVHVFQNEKNLGYTLNFLQGLCNTTADYIMFCDQDDVWKPNKIADTLKRLRLMEAQLGKDKPIAVFTDAVVVDSQLNEIQPSFFKAGKLNPNKTDLAHILMENKLIGCTVMINAALRKLLQSRRLPEQARYHDWWIALIAASCGKIGFLPEQTLFYRQHGSNVVGNRNFLSYMKNRITSLKKQKEAILALYTQAEEFMSLYQDILPKDSGKIIQRFASLNHARFLKRRIILLKYGYLKTGIIRNIGLMFIV